MNVSLTPELERRIGEKVASGLYQTASEVVREAIRQFFAEETKAGLGFIAQSEEVLEQKLLHSLESGPAKIMRGSDWQRIRRRVNRRLKKRP